MVSPTLLIIDKFYLNRLKIVINIHPFLSLNRALRPFFGLRLRLCFFNPPKQRPNRLGCLGPILVSEKWETLTFGKFSYPLFAMRNIAWRHVNAIEGVLGGSYSPTTSGTEGKNSIFSSKGFKNG